LNNNKKHLAEGDLAIKFKLIRLDEEE